MATTAHAPRQPLGDANTLAPEIWPASSERDGTGVLHIGGVSAVELANRFGTPLYVLDENVVRERAARLRRAFTRAAESAGTTANIYYAGKAFLSTEVARWVTQEGLRVDVCTGGELAVVLAAGVDPALVGFHGNNKSVVEIDRAVGVGVGTIVIDSEIEVERVAASARRAGRIQRVRLRVNSGVHASTHEFLATSHEDQKFGLPLESAVELGERIRSYAELEFLGLHCHIGSQIFGAAGFIESAQRLLEVHAELARKAPLPELNLGGGFGIAYTPADDPDAIEQLANALVEAISEAAAKLKTPIPVLAFEPGRWIIGPAGITLYTAGTVKPVITGEGVRNYVSVDGGMSDNARPALYGAKYTARIASRVSKASPVLVRLAGKHCETGDIVVDREYLPGDIAPGDLIAIAATGAYCWSLASNYNHILRPPVIAIRDGGSRVIVHGDTEEGLLARDAGVAASNI